MRVLRNDLIICENYKNCENNDWCIHARPHEHNLSVYATAFRLESLNCGICNKQSHIKYIRNKKIEKINENN